jgi:tetratricopeptide (TPR) repeat protein
VKELATTPEQKKALEDKLGQRVASQDAARTLRSLVLDAGEALSAGRHAVAAKKLRAARTLCRLSGLTREEATMLVMVGAAHMNAGDEKRALAAYGEAKAMGEEHGYTDTVVQALFGIAGVHVAARRFGEAEKHYAEVEAVATEELAPLRLEALRMRGICLERLGDRAGAIVRYESALALAEDLGPLPASHTGYRDAGERLIAAHAASGKMSLVAATKARLEALALSPDERPRKLEERAS